MDLPLRKSSRGPRTISLREELTFFPTYGYRTPGGGWTLMVQGCVFNPRISWIHRLPIMGFIRRAMQVDSVGMDYYRERMRRFFVDYSRNRAVTVRVVGRQIAVGHTGAAGLFREGVPISIDEAAALPRRPDLGPDWVEFAAVLSEGDERIVLGTAQLLEAKGVSIISDVDDTLKHSNVPNRRDLFHNTFSRPFVSIAGMPELYRKCTQAGAALHFVSGSPWQLYEPLRTFFDEAGLPPGSYHLKRFQFRETARKIRGMSPQRGHKRMAIQPIISSFPERKFILVGDSGEQDPEIYAEFLRDYPQQVIGVFIRGVRQETVHDPRLQRTFDGLPADRWDTFQAAEDLSEKLLKLVLPGEGSETV